MLPPHPFLEGLRVEQLRVLEEFSMTINFRSGEEILSEGDPANRFYLILSGKVVVESYVAGHRHPIQVLGTGDALGWSWLFPPYFWRFSARSVESVHALFFYATPLRQACESEPEFGYALVTRAASIMLERLQSTRKRLLAAEARIAEIQAPKSAEGL